MVSQPPDRRAYFYLGSPNPAWLEYATVPLFISSVRLQQRKSPLQAVVPWALDSGGFSELSAFGAWRTTARQYATTIRRALTFGNLHWAAPQDWMCEPHILRKTGLTVQTHQDLTTVSVLELRSMGLPVIPVLQGFSLDDYLRHRDQYEQVGLPLDQEATVGIGSVCRRQGTTEVEGLIRRLHSDGLNLHGFGFKVLGLRRVTQYLKSADSMAWSFVARREKIRLPGHTHMNCANCLEWATMWRNKLKDVIT